MDVQPIEKFTVATLKARCKKMGINYGKVTKKADLYRLCVLGESLSGVSSGAGTTKTSKMSKPKKISIKDCLLNEEGAEICIGLLKERYPGIFPKFCGQIIEGPAVGIVRDRGKTVGMVDEGGEVLPVIPPIPGPPPPFIPIVQTAGISQKRQLLKVLDEKTEDDVVAPRDDLLEQINKAKEKLQAPPALGERPKGNIMQQLTRAIRGGVPLRKIDQEQAKKEAAKYKQQVRLQTDKRAALFEDIKGGAAKLKRVKRPSEPLFELCEKGLYWDSLLKKCVAINPDVTAQEARQATVEVSKNWFGRMFNF